MAGYISHFKHAPDCGVFEISVPFDESGLQNFRKLHSIDEFELMQFTGLTDKNGKEIYENDVVKLPVRYRGDNRFTESAGEVIWAVDSWWVNNMAEATWAELEVIGNIWENPELLK